MSLNFLFLDGARAVLSGSRVTLIVRNQPDREMAIDELPQPRIDELLSYGAIKLIANPMEVTCPATRATSA
jgi:hypothetical protein